MEEDLIKIENELKKIKTTQKTLDDSYKYYFFRSENLAFTEGTVRTYRVSFIPSDGVTEGIICNFTTLSGYASVWYDAVSVSPDSGAECTIIVRGYNASLGIPDWRKFFYLTCWSNKQGELKLTRIE